MWVLLFCASHIITGGTASAGREGEHKVELPPFCSLCPGKAGSEWSSGVAPVLPWALCFMVFLVSGLGRECGCGWFVRHCFFFSQRRHRHFCSPFCSLSQELHGSGCDAATLSQTQWAFLHVITLFYTLLLLVLLLLVFLISLLTFFSKFLSQPIISTLIPLSLEGKENSCLECNFQLVSNHNIQK